MACKQKPQKKQENEPCVFLGRLKSFREDEVAVLSQEPTTKPKWIELSASGSEAQALRGSGGQGM